MVIYFVYLNPNPNLLSARFDEWLIVSIMLLLAELGVGYFFERWVRRRTHTG